MGGALRAADRRGSGNVLWSLLGHPPTSSTVWAGDAPGPLLRGLRKDRGCTVLAVNATVARCRVCPCLSAGGLGERRPGGPTQRDPGRFAFPAPRLRTRGSPVARQCVSHIPKRIRRKSRTSQPLVPCDPTPARLAVAASVPLSAANFRPARSRNTACAGSRGRGASAGRLIRPFAGLLQSA